MRLYPDREIFYRQLACEQMKLGKLDDAFEAASTALEKSFHLRSADLALVSACIDAKADRIEDARGWIKIALEIDSSDAMKVRVLEMPELERVWTEAGSEV